MDSLPTNQETGSKGGPQYLGPGHAKVHEKRDHHGRSACYDRARRRLRHPLRRQRHQPRAAAGGDARAAARHRHGRLVRLMGQPRAGWPPTPAAQPARRTCRQPRWRPLRARRRLGRRAGDRDLHRRRQAGRDARRRPSVGDAELARHPARAPRPGAGRASGPSPGDPPRDRAPCEPRARPRRGLASAGRRRRARTGPGRSGHDPGDRP